MNQNEYQAAAERTANVTIKPEDLTPAQLSLLNAALGLAGEVGELVDHIKKHVFHGHPLERTYVVPELGDIGWYRSWIASIIGWDLEDIDIANIEKLRKRYPEGFSQEASIKREQ